MCYVPAVCKLMQASTCVLYMLCVVSHVRWCGALATAGCSKFLAVQIGGIVLTCRCKLEVASHLFAMQFVLFRLGEGAIVAYMLC